jgi:hypothetical protein
VIFPYEGNRRWKVSVEVAEKRKENEKFREAEQKKDVLAKGT